VLGTVYKIGGTNLEGKIGFDAGMVWTVISKQQTDVDISSLVRLTKININDVFAAIGWLTRENKIETKTIMNKKNQQLKVNLK
jgi:methylglyoxal synthase